MTLNLNQLRWFSAFQFPSFEQNQIIQQVLKTNLELSAFAVLHIIMIIILP